MISRPWETMPPAMTLLRPFDDGHRVLRVVLLLVALVAVGTSCGNDPGTGGGAGGAAGGGIRGGAGGAGGAGGGSNSGGTGGGSGNAGTLTTCAGLRNCIGACDTDVACKQACDGRASAAARTSHAAVKMCSTEECDEDDHLCRCERECIAGGACDEVVLVCRGFDEDPFCDVNCH